MNNSTLKSMGHRIQIDTYNTRSNHPDLFAHGIMIAIARLYHHSVLRIRMYEVYQDGTEKLLCDTIYEAVGKGSIAIVYDEWIKKNKIIECCDVTKTKCLTVGQSEEVIRKAVKYSHQKTKYGYWSIAGIVAWYFLKAKTVGADSDASLICSELVYTACSHFLPTPDRPVSYISPRTLHKSFDFEKHKDCDDEIGEVWVS